MRIKSFLYIVTALLIIALTPIAGQTFEVDTLHYNGSSDTLINFVVLGDGYLEEELPKFIQDAEDAMDAFFQESPFDHYRNFFNFFAIKVPSNVSGAALDPADPVDNYFGSTFNAYYDIDRLLVPMNNTAITSVLANNFPNYDQVVMIVNSDKYGGSGGWVATFSTNESAREIFLHELGHSFSDLADEYWAGSQYAGEFANMTQENNPEKLRWKNWYNQNGIGLYPHSESPTWYRPHQDCLMRYLGRPFCAVCRQEIIETIHEKVNPVLSFSPGQGRLTPGGAPFEFNLNLLYPTPNTLRIEWLLDGKRAQYGGDSFTLNPLDLSGDLTSLTVTVEDTTEMLRVDDHQMIHMTVLSWEISDYAAFLEETPANGPFEFSIYPNPFVDQLQLKNNGPSLENLEIQLYDLSGRLLRIKSLESDAITVLQTGDLTTGSYVLKVLRGGQIMLSRMVQKQ